MIADLEIARAFETTWPANETVDSGALRSGRGNGAGGRVSSTRPLSDDWHPDDIAAAEAVHQGWAQRPMFRLDDLGDANTRLAAALQARGYRTDTPTAIMAADCSVLMAEVPRLTTFTIWPPMAIQQDLWAAGDIDAARQSVMDRVAVPKTAILGRLKDRAAGAAFVAVDGPVAMIHAIVVVPELRRQGLAGWMVRTAANWAHEQGADRLALAVSRSNTGARASYDGLGFCEVAGYSYWAKD